MMKQLNIFSLVMYVAICFNTSCTNAQQPTSEKGEFMKAKTILIVYLSRTKNTKAVAEMINKNVGGKLVELELQNPYPEDYHEIVNQVVNENASGYLPPLKTKIDSIQKYDLIFIGFPTWDMKIPPPIKSFLRQYNLTNKIVVPFNTNAGYGVGSGFETVKQLCPHSKILEGYSTTGGIEKDGILFVMEGEKEVQVKSQVAKWLHKIKIIQ
jgi:flavodoxin